MKEYEKVIELAKQLAKQHEKGGCSPMVKNQATRIT